MANMAQTSMELAVTVQQQGGLVHRTHRETGADLPGRSVSDFRIDWVHAFGTIRIEVKAGEVCVDGRVVRPEYVYGKEKAIRSSI